MELLKFISLLNKKPISYRLIWIDIISSIDNGGVNISVLISKHDVSLTSFYRVFKLMNTDILISDKTYRFYIKNSIVLCDVFNIENTTKNIVAEIKKEIPKKITNPNIDKTIETVKIIIDYLNIQSGKNFKYKSSNTVKFISARLSEGYALDDFKKVIDVKCIKWLNTSMEEYLRPQTLFSNKFDGYLNETVAVKKDRIDRIYDTINEANKFN